MRKRLIAFAVFGVAFAAITILFLIITNAPSKPIDLDENAVAIEFVNYIARYQKGYATKDEFHKRKEIYKATMRRVL